jgi:hypothetical protein
VDKWAARALAARVMFTPAARSHCRVRPRWSCAHIAATLLCALSRYVVEGGELQVNLPANIQKAVVASVASGRCDGDTFTDPCAEIFNLMRRDTLPRFGEDALFSDVMAALGEPSPIPSADPKPSLSEASSSFSALRGGLSFETGPSSEQEKAPAAGYASNYSADGQRTK